MKKQAENKYAVVTLHDDVLTVVMKPNIDLGIPEMAELLEFSANFQGYQKRYTIIDTRSNYNSTPEVRDFYAKSEYNKYRLADAFIVNSLAMRLLINFYIKINKPSIPSKMFNTPEAAVAWIDSLKIKESANQQTLTY